MTRWLLYWPLVTLAMLVSYILNPIVVLFCDENGELHGLLKLFQTWDDSCYSAYFAHSVCPSWLNYDFDAHYTTVTDTDEWSAPYGKMRTFSIIRPDATWTTKQRIQRYLCAVWWLMRNCGYGWCMYVFGGNLDGAAYSIQEQDKFYCRNDKYFCYKNESKICNHLYWKIYLGWKTYPGNDNTRLCMYANRLYVKVVL